VSITTDLGVAETTCGVATGLSPLLQLRTVVSRRSSDDVSVPYLGVLLVGVVSCRLRRRARQRPADRAALKVSNAVALTTYALTTAAVLRFR
jgi:hypothetical protein